MSCSGNGYLTGNTLIPFPFEDGQFLDWPDGVPASEAQLALQKCFTDASVRVNAPEISEDGWPRIGDFSVSGQNTISFSIAALGESVRVTAAASREKFPIISGLAPFGSYVVVLCSEAIREFCLSSFPPPVTGNSSASWREGGCFMRICPKCVTLRNACLMSIRVFDGVQKMEDGPHFVLTGDVSVMPGNNVGIEEQDGTNGMIVNATPGAGLGAVRCGCTDESQNGLQVFSPDGHTRIFNDTCYDIEPRIESVNRNGSVRRVGTLQVHAKCTACCTCEMYASIVNDRLAPLADLIRQAKTTLSGLLSDYESAVAKFNRRISVPTLEDVSVSLSGMPVGSNLGSKLENTGVRGKMGRCAFTAIVRNSSYAVMSAVIYQLSGTDKIVEATASWSDVDGYTKSKSSDSADGIIGVEFMIRPGQSLVVTFISSREELVGSVRTGGYTGSISVGLSYTSSDGTSGSLGVIDKTVEV